MDEIKEIIKVPKLNAIETTICTSKSKLSHPLTNVYVSLVSDGELFIGLEYSKFMGKQMSKIVTAFHKITKKKSDDIPCKIQLDLPYYAFYGLFTVNNIPTKFETTNEEIVRKILPDCMDLKHDHGCSSIIVCKKCQVHKDKPHSFKLLYNVESERITFSFLFCIYNHINEIQWPLLDCGCTKCEKPQAINSIQ